VERDGAPVQPLLNGAFGVPQGPTDVHGFSFLREQVYVNSKKYAWYVLFPEPTSGRSRLAILRSASCIKGHRSSQCHHSDRALFEIKKKGRPLTQCDQCRAARRSRRFHSKCECNDNSKEDDRAKQAIAAASGSKCASV
jgi:hypothetical protein